MSDSADNPGRIAEGPLKGQTPAQLIAADPAAIPGNLAPRLRRFALLLKFLDVSAMLWVQVHPPATQAELIPAGDTAKAEGWVVLAARPHVCRAQPWDHRGCAAHAITGEHR